MRTVICGRVPSIGTGLTAQRCEYILLFLNSGNLVQTPIDMAFRGCLASLREVAAFQEQIHSVIAAHDTLVLLGPIEYFNMQGLHSFVL